MIVRILGEGQYEIDDAGRDRLTPLDDALIAAIDAGDEDSFAAALTAVAAEIRSIGTPVPDDRFIPSDLVVPFADATLDETRRLLAEGAAGPANG